MEEADTASRWRMISSLRVTIIALKSFSSAFKSTDMLAVQVGLFDVPKERVYQPYQLSLKLNTVSAEST